MKSRPTNMWNLSGDDIQRAKEELKGRRAAIKAHYDSEMKQLEADIAAIEKFERAAVDFVSNFKGEEGPSASPAKPDPEPVAEPVAADGTGEQSNSSEDSPVRETAELEVALGPAPSAEPATGAKGSSRWRMRLGTQ
jgi:hypothetical protein